MDIFEVEFRAWSIMIYARMDSVNRRKTTMSGGMSSGKIDFLRLNLGPFQCQASHLVHALIIASHSYIITEKLH